MTVMGVSAARSDQRAGFALADRIGVQLQATSLYNKITPREALDLFGSYYPKRRGTDERHHDDHGQQE